MTADGSYEPSYGVLLGGFVWPPCCDLIQVRPFGYRLRTQRVGEERRMWLWLPTKRLALAAAKRWVEREGRRG